MVHGITVDGCNPGNWAEPGVYESLERERATALNATIAIWEGLEETVDATAAWHRRFRERSDTLLQVRTAQDIVRVHETGRSGIILDRRNLSPIENDLEGLEAFAVLGVRVAQPACNVRNLVANGCREPHDEGLSLFGVKVVKRLNELGILVDLSHVGDRSGLHAIEGLETNAEIPSIASGLGKRGYGREEVDKIMGGDRMRLYREVWGA